MADCVRCFICSISRENPIAFSCSDLYFIDCIIPESQGSSVFGEGLDKRFVISMGKSPQSVIFTSNKEFWLLNACFSKETDSSKKRSGHCELNIFVLEGFLHNHGLQAGQFVWVKRVNPVPLQTVLLGISCDEDFVWAQNSLGSFLLEDLSSGPIVVRENDSVFLSRHEHKSNGEMHRSQLHVLRCQPVLQGSITTETSTVISKLESPENVLSLDIERNTPVADAPESFGTYLISDFTCNLPRVEGQNVPGNMDEISQLRACVLDWEEMKRLDIGYDDCSVVLVNVASLISLCLFHGSWVKISTSQSAHRRKDITCNISGQSEMTTPKKPLGGQVEMHSLDKRSGTSNEGSKDISSIDTVSYQENCDYHIVQVFATNVKDESNLIIPVNTDMKDDESIIDTALFGDNQTETGMAYMSPLLYFNVFGRKLFCDITPNTIYISSVCEKTVGSSYSDLSTVSTATTGRTNSPPFAKEVHIAIVHSPLYKVGDSFNGSLALHFKKARLLTVGDVFFVQHSWFENVENGKSEEQGIQSVLVYFLVTQLVCQGGKVKSCFVNTEHSSLYQRGSVHSYVPSALEPFLCFGKNSEDVRPSYWKQTTCPGLENYILALENIVKPYLNLRLFHSLASSAILLTGPRGCGKKTVVMATGRRLSLQMYKVNCYDLIGESVGATEARVKKMFQNASSCSPCVLLLQDIEALGKDREGTNDEPRIPTVMLDCINNLTRDTDWPIVVIATSSSPSDITAEVFSCFLHEVKLEPPTEGERLEMLNALAEMAHVGRDVSVKQLAKRTAGMVLGDFVAMFNYACYAGEKRLLQRCSKDEHHSSKEELTDEASNELWSLQKVEQDLCQMGVSLCWQDFEESLEVLQSTMSDSIGAPKIPSVKWEDVGGLTEVKAEILDTVQLPLQHPELFAAGLRRSGVLLYGPPGTGKTLLAKAVATECSLNFLSVKGPELINMYVGQSEQNVREVFARAQSARPCVIFFDELDSLAPNRGKSGDSGGVMDRVVSQLLAELDGLHKACDVFVIGATNRPDLLDPALLRPGRFDKLLYLGVNKDAHSQVNILKALTRKFNLSSDLRLENVATLCPSSLTGADLYALCSDAMLQAVRREIEQLEAGTKDQATNTEIQVTERDFKAAVNNLVPSVSVQELKRYRDLQKQFTSTSSGPL